MSTSIFSRKAPVLLAIVLLALSASRISAQTTAFTYQGRLSDGGNPANGTYDFEFMLYDALAGGTAQGLPVQRLNVAVASGIFTVQLDFGNQFNGANRFLDINVRASGGEAFTPLAPRQQVTSNPYAIKSLNSSTADGLSAACVNCVTSSQIQSVQGSQVTGSITGSQISGAIPVASIPVGSGNYIQNTNAVQAASNFNISGNGTAGGTLSANTVNATTQYNIGGNRVLTASFFSSNVFAGLGAGAANIGNSNSFFCASAGNANTSGNANSFFGASAGASNTTGFSNAFFGSNAGVSNTTGRTNAFFGTTAGQLNTTGVDNSYFGIQAGFSNQTGNNNSFFGRSAGLANTASDNSFFGMFAGESNTTGTRNSFLGRSAGDANIIGSDNAFFGYHAGSSNLASFNSFFGSLAGDSNTFGVFNAFFGRLAGEANTTGDSNSFFGQTAGLSNTIGINNTFIGRFAGGTNTIGNNNTYIGFNAGGNPAITNAAAIGVNAFVSASHQIVIGTDTNFVLIPGSITAAKLKIFLLAGGGNTPLCRNDFDEVAFCSSSLRYKTRIAPFNPGVNLVNRLRPITFDWKAGGSRDLGLGAEEVAAVEPLLVTYNKAGQVEGVKYDRIGVVLLNAVKEQQAQLEQQQDQIKRQQVLIDDLRRLICQSSSQADICKENK